MGKKNKMKHETAQSAGPESTFANSKIGKKNNPKNKAFISEKKKSLIAVQNSETTTPLKKIPTSPSKALNAQNNNKNKKSKNKHVLSQDQDTHKHISNKNTGSSKNKKKRKRNKQNDSVSEEQSKNVVVKSPNSNLKCATDKSGSDQQLSKSARRRLKKKLEKKNQEVSSSETTKGIDNYISLTSPTKSAGERNGLSKPNNKDNVNHDSPKKKSSPNNQSVLPAANVPKTKSIYSASSSDDELDFDTSDEESDENKSGVEHLKKKENQQLIKSIGTTLKESPSDIESDDEQDDADSSSEEDLPKERTPKKHVLTKNITKQDEEEEDEEEEDEEEESEEEEGSSFKWYKTATIKINHPKESAGVNKTLSNMEIDEEDSAPSLNMDEWDSSEDDGQNPNEKLPVSSLVDESRKRKMVSSQKQLQEEKDVRNNDSDDSSDEGEENDEEDDGDVAAKDFVDLEAEEGEETDENSNEEEEAPPAKKSKHSFVAADQDSEDENKVFINNLPPNTTEDSLAQALSEAGDALSITIPKSRDNPGECRGFAFVTLADKETLDKVLQLDKVAEIDGQTVNIRLYTNDKGGRGGFRGSPGGRGFRGGRGGFRSSSDGRGRGFKGSPGGRGGGFRGGSPGGRGGGFRGSNNRGGGFRGSGDRDGGFRGRGGRGFRGSPGGRGRGFRGGRGGSSE